MPVDTAAPVVAQMADADPPLEAMAVLQRKIASLEKTIQDENEELNGYGMQLPDRLAALKPKEEQLAQLREKEIILLQQQLRTREGTPCLCLAHYPLPRVHR
jgi:hypothetical protein